MDPVLYRAETCGLNIENNIGICKSLSLGIFYQLLGIIYQIAFHTIQDLKGIPLSNAWFAQGRPERSRGP